MSLPFFLIWSTCRLVSASKTLFLSTDLNLKPVAVLLLKLWFSGFDTNRFHIFFIFRYLRIFNFFQYSHSITLLTVYISQYWGKKFEHVKVLKDIDQGFNGFDITFLNNLIHFLNFVFICRFRRKKFPAQKQVSFVFHKKLMSRFSDISRYLMAFMSLKTIVF